MLKVQRLCPETAREFASTRFALEGYELRFSALFRVPQQPARMKVGPDYGSQCVCPCPAPERYITLQSERKPVAALETPRVTPGWNAVDFHLKGTDEKVYTLADVRGPKGLLVMFICNHCPFLQAIASKLTRDTKGLAAIGIGSVAIMSNDAVAYPEDLSTTWFVSRRDTVGSVSLDFPHTVD